MKFQYRGLCSSEKVKSYSQEFKNNGNSMKYNTTVDKNS